MMRHIMVGFEGSMFGLSRFKLAWLIALTLVAGTLSARAWAVPVETSDRKDRPARSGGTDPAKPEKPDRSKATERTIEIAPQADVWHGVSDRPLVRRPTAVPEHPPIGILFQPDGRPTARRSRLQPALPPDHRPAERYRLICRYAHAPPVGA